MRGKLSSYAEAALGVALGAWVLLSTAWAIRGAWGFTTDDAFITLRYARHLASGHGITWNVGEAPLEGFSNFSFLLFGAATMKTGLEPVLVLKWTGAVGLLAALCISHALSREWVGPVLAWVPAQLLTTHKGTVGWSVSGLETGFYLAVSIGATALTAARLRRPDAAHCVPLAACCAFVAALTRPEGVLVATCCLGSLALVDRRAAARFALFVAVPFAAYTTCRLAYFGHLLPNSVRCKMGYDDDPWKLVRDFLRFAWPLLIIGAAYPPKNLDARHALLWSIILTHVVAFRGVDPVLGDFNRYFLLPGLLAAVLAVASVGKWLSLTKSHRRSLEVLFALLGTSVLVPQRAEAADAAREWANWYGSRISARAALGSYLRDSLPENATYVQADAGLVGYIAPQRTIDTLCLNSAEMTKFGPDSNAFVDWLFTQKPEVIVVPSETGELSGAYRRFGVHQKLIARPEFREQYDFARKWDGSGVYYIGFRRRDGSGGLR